MAMITVVAVGATIQLGLSAHPAAAAPTPETVEDEQEFVQLINGLRTGHGLEPLTIDGELVAGARGWTDTMATRDQLAHSPDMTVGVTAQWSVLGENVGVHGVENLESLFQAFVDSPAHYRNLIDPRYRYVGVGVTHTADGKLWTTHRFMAAPAAAAPTAASPPAPTAPPTTTTPTTSPPTTVSTPPTPTTSAGDSGQDTAPSTTINRTTEPTGGPATEPDPETTTGTNRPAGDETQDSVDGPATEPATTGGEPTIGNDDRAGGSGADFQPVIDQPGNGDRTRADIEAERREMAGLVRPDPETVEDVLHELVLAGI